MARGADVGTKRAKADKGTWLVLVTALGVAVVLVFVVPVAVLPTVAAVPVDVLAPVT